MHIRQGGAWVAVASPSIRAGAAWVDVQAGWVMKGGAWTAFYVREVLPPAPTDLFATDASYCDFGDPVYVVHLEWTNGDPTKGTRIYGPEPAVDVAAGETSYDWALSGGGDLEFYVVHFNADTNHEGGHEDPTGISIPDPC